MAQRFAAASSQYLNTGASTAPVSAVPLTMVAWGNLTGTSNFTAYAIATIANSSTGDAFNIMADRRSTGQIRCRIGSTINGGTSNANSGILSGYADDTWYHFAGVFTSTTSRDAYINGGNVGSDTTSSNPNANDAVYIGRFRSTATNYYNGSIAEVGIWNAALSAAEVLELSKGISPLYIRPDNLVFYTPLIRDRNLDLVGGLTLTANGSPTVATHPPQIYYPRPKFFFLPPTLPPNPQDPGKFNHWITNRITFTTVPPKTSNTGTFDRWVTNRITFADYVVGAAPPGPSPVTIPLGTLTLASSAPTLTVTVPAGASTVNVSTLTLASSAPALAVVAGEVSTLLNTITLASNSENLAVVTGAVSVLLESLTLASNPEDLAVTAGAIAVLLDTLTLASSAEDLAVAIGAVAIALDTLTLASSTENLTITAGAVAVVLETLTLASSAESIAVAAGAISVVLNELTLAGSPQSITVITSGTISPNTLSLTGLAQSLTVVPGAISVSLSTLTLSSNTETISIGQIVSLNTLTLAGSAETLAVVPGLVSAALGSLSLASSTESLTAFVSQIVLLSELTLSGSAENLVVTPGLVSVLLNSISLASNAETLTLITAGTIAVNELSLAANAEDLVVVPGAVSALLQALTLASSAEVLLAYSDQIVVLNELILTGSAETIANFTSGTIGLVSLELLGIPEQLTTAPGSISVLLSSVSLAGSAEALALIAGEVSALLNSLSLASSAETLTAFSTGLISLNSLTLVSSTETLTVTPGLVSVLLNSVTLVSSPEVLTTLVGDVVGLNSLTLFASPEDLTTRVNLVRALRLDTLELSTRIYDLRILGAGERGLSPELTAEMNSLIRHSVSELTVEQYLPRWEAVHTPLYEDVYLFGHAAVVLSDGKIFRARSGSNENQHDGKLYIAVLDSTDIASPTTWDSEWIDTGITGLMHPSWTANTGAAYGGSISVVAKGTSARAFYFRADGNLAVSEFNNTGGHVSTANVANVGVGPDMQCGAVQHDEVFFIQHDLVELSQSAWHKDVYGTTIYRFVEDGAWQQDTNPFLFHTHAEAHAAKDGPDVDDPSSEVEAQWGNRPCGGMAVNNINDDTVTVSLAMRFWRRFGYNTHNQGLITFTYHRDNGLWSRGPESGVADYLRDQRLYLDSFAKGSEIEGNNFVVWSKNTEPSEFDQLNNAETIPRVREVVYVKLSADGQMMTQYQYLGPQDDLTGASLVAATDNLGDKHLYAIGWGSVYRSDPSSFLCSVPTGNRQSLGDITPTFATTRTNRWRMDIKGRIAKGEVVFDAGYIQEGNLIRAYHGNANEVVQIAQAFVDGLGPDLSVMQMQHVASFAARADKYLLDTKAETIEDILPHNTLFIRPITPGGYGSCYGSPGENSNVRQPNGVALHKGWWLLSVAKWPAMFFPGDYDFLEDREIYRLESFPWSRIAEEAGVPGRYISGPGDVADDRKAYKKGTWFSDVAWVALPPMVDGSIQASVRFGDWRNYPNYDFTDKNGSAVTGTISRSNGLITSQTITGAGTVQQGATMAGLICHAVQGKHSTEQTGKKYMFIWEANSNFLASTHINVGEGELGQDYFDKPNFGAFNVGANKLYLLLSDYNDENPNWQADGDFLHTAVIGGIDALGLTPGRPADMKIQVLGGVIHCYYREYQIGGGNRNRWRWAFDYNAGRFGAGRFGVVGRGQATVQWDKFLSGSGHIDQTDNVVDFWDIDASDNVLDRPMEEVLDRYVFRGLSEATFNSRTDETDLVLGANTAYDFGKAVKHVTIDFTVTIDDSGGEAGVYVRSNKINDPLDGSVWLGIEVNDTHYDATTRHVYCQVVKRVYLNGSEDNSLRNYSPIPLHLKPGRPYRCRVTAREEVYTVWIEGNYAGHFREELELGNYYGLYTLNSAATFNVRVPELHEVPQYALLDVNQSMQDAIGKVLGKRRIKGAYKVDGKLMISYFDEHAEDGPDYRDTLVQNSVQKTDRFISILKVEGAYTSATYASETLLARGRRFEQVHNPDIMTAESCYREAKALVQESAERMLQATFSGLPDLRSELEDVSGIIITQQAINGDFIIDDISMNFSQGTQATMTISARQRFIL